MNSRWLDAQNSAEAQQALAASDVLWADVQTIRGAQVVLAVFIPMVASAVALLHPIATTQLGAAYVGVSMAVLDVVLGWFAARRRSAAAQMQDRFDSIALHLDRTRFRADDDLDVAVASALASRQSSSRSARNIDWYTPTLRELPLEYGRIACMRESTSWDASLRRLWASALLVLIAVGLVFVASWLVLTGQKGDVVFLSVVAPLAPSLIWALREALDQFGAASTYESVRAKVRAMWDSAVAGQAGESALRGLALESSWALLGYRSAASPVPHWLYSVRRGRNEATAADVARVLLDEYRNRATGKPG